MNLKRFNGIILCLLAMACGNPLEKLKREPHPYTGGENSEIRLGSVQSRTKVQEGKVYYISTDSLRVRAQDSFGDNILGKLNTNDKVKVIDASSQLNDSFVQIEIIEFAEDEVKKSSQYFVSYKYLNESPIKFTASKSRYFIIQNLATERLRVYERGCQTGACDHKMIFEAEMAVGEDTKETQSVLGYFNVTSWHKFYQDGAANYPSWYHSSLPMPPGPHSNIMDWTDKKYMPYGGSMRGAFGWYTAKLGPDAHYQWIHGTYGWGADKKTMIKGTKTLLANVLADPRSHGCSRLDNESIAYLRQIINIGTPVIKVYAKEMLNDPSLSRYRKKKDQWEYILTKRGARSDGQKADKEEVLSSGINNDEIIEEGLYDVDIVPTIIPYQKPSRGLLYVPHLTEALHSWKEKTGKRGNLYRVAEKEMKGFFYVDTGLFSSYGHPASLVVGGKKGVIVPQFVDMKNKYKTKK